MSASSICLEGMNRTALLKDAKAGNRDSFAQLIGPYAMNLYRSALRLTASATDAEDVRQEAILKAMLRLEQFEGRRGDCGEDLHSWLSRIARNTAIDVIRKKRKGKILSLDEPVGGDGEPFLATIRSSEQNPEERYSRNESRKKLANAISLLPAELRQACLLRDVMQYSTQEVAEELGISAMAVRLRLFRAHNRLRATLTAGFPRKTKETQADFSAFRNTKKSFRSLSTGVAPTFASGD
jgi:RNA polymerase sigma-70 factor, ECF subfamily